MVTTRKGQALYTKAKKLIPGGTQLLSKRPELHLPGQWPSYYTKAKGCQVWDLDGNCFIDMSYMGIGACILGYANPAVDNAVKKAIDRGTMTTLNCPEEVELADELCRIHPWAEMARFTRGGGEAMAVAVRIARAYTNKDIVLFCGYHGWHDWYLSANLSDKKSLNTHLLSGLHPKGVPANLSGTVIGFEFNNTKEFLNLWKKYGKRVAAVVMEPIRNDVPTPTFLETIRTKTRQNHSVLIFDEITSGWRLCVGGAHKTFGVDPDIAVFAKAISNGYPMSAIIGRRAVMDAAQSSFISSTYWTERIGPTAALATIKFLKDHQVPIHLNKIGHLIQVGWKEAARKTGTAICVGGMAPLSHFAFEDNDPLLAKTVFTQLMLDKGFLAITACYTSFAHTTGIAKEYLDAVEETFKQMSFARHKKGLAKLLKGSVCQSGFKRLN